MTEGPSDWERGDTWSVDEDTGEVIEERLPESTTREAWNIASQFVSDYLDEGEPPHREPGTSEAYLTEAKRALRLHELDPGRSTWAEVIGHQALIVQGTTELAMLRQELGTLGLYVMQWLHDLNDQEDAADGPLPTG